MPDIMASPSTGDAMPQFDAVVVGAGFAGLYQLHCLRDRLGLSVQLLEAADGVGGTWYWNRYPGARCDSESHCYSYSFSKELEQEWEWSERYPRQPEILRYLNHVADCFDLRRSIRFKARVTGAEYDAGANLWRVTVESGETLSARFLITAVGCLSTANVAKIPGLETFEGKWHHTGQWPHEGVNFSGQRVGVIGTGSTAIQAIPVIAEQAAQLTVFQRTPNYSVPARNGPLTPEFQRYLKDNYAEIRRKMRESVNGFDFFISERSALEASEAERQALFEEAWERGGLRFRATFKDILLDKAANDTAADFIRAKIRSIVKDPVTAAKLSDIDHPYAAKRPPIDTNYFETYNRDNVSLVDVRAAPIERITPRGLKTTGGEYALDTIVFATGFDAMTGPLLRMNVTGRDGCRLKDIWSAGPRTYLGLQVPGFPNLFTITGPGSPSVLCNMPVAIEQHVEFITDCIAYMRTHRLSTVEATSEATEKWAAQVNEAANVTLLPQAKHSWYLGANIPGKPRVFMPYAGGMARYRRICEDVAARQYEGLALGA
jgi:cation diffusion facilitator CzcD-associated flavoprotein CzcO